MLYTLLYILPGLEKKSRWVGGGGSLNSEILKGGGGVLKQFWKSRWKGGGSKNMPSIGGACGFF